MMIDSGKVQRLMLERQLGTMELTKLSGLPSKTISTVVNRDARARIPTITKLARALSVSPMELVRR